jgi:folate-binding protein YgfZ
MGEADWERLRIVQGRPSPGAELTDAFNPLEAGLCHAVSISKGCYIGQETIAKVRLHLHFAPVSASASAKCIFHAFTAAPSAQVAHVHMLTHVLQCCIKLSVLHQA